MSKRRRIEARLEDAVAVSTRKGHGVRLEVRERFSAWADAELRVIDDVQDVREDAQGFVIRRLDGRPPVRLPRQRVSRGRTTRYTWLEITGIERP